MGPIGGALFGVVAVAVVVVVAAAVTFARIIQSVVTGQAPVTLEWNNTPGEKKTNQKWYTYTRIT